MNLKERTDLHKMLSILSKELNEIAEDTDDIETSDRLNELVGFIDDNAFQLYI